jgi:ribosomal protein L11 methyltransferase
MTKKRKRWFAVAVSVAAGAEEAVEFALNELESLGSEIDQLSRKDAETLLVKGYFEEPPDIGSFKTKLSEALEIFGFSGDSVKNIETAEIPDTDWLAEWKKYWKPTETARFIIAPPWEEIANPEKIVIRIEPQMAFGTGTHETTKLCLRAIEENYRAGMSFFDIGTGTGILAIAAAKIAAASKTEKARAKIVGCDTDPDAVKIAAENAVLNDVGEIGFYVGSISEETPAGDFVCANVTADVIIPLLPLLLAKSQRILVSSGILAAQEDKICQALKGHNFENPSVERDGEWISVTIRKQV